ncbi:MAG: hypothetical protein JNK04_15375 [Myxococcales bacterium]|nr:hypothetical protein [Myxococcales bacterium]
MSIDALRRAIAEVPSPVMPPIAEALVQQSERYLSSEAAFASLEADAYWPKWDSPWWHMLLLFEIDEAERIPVRMVEAMVARLNAMPLHIFPIHPEEAPLGTDPWRDMLCHCAVGSIHQVLGACGVDVASALPWAEVWLDRYQMADGGANCDERAYLSGECASSMVATIAPFEAMLAGPPSARADRAAAFMIERELMKGSPSKHNAAERDAAPSWLHVCFPRFYFYDVLRGLCALVRWSTKYERHLPLRAIEAAAGHLVSAFPDGVVRVQRRAFAGLGTLAKVAGEWQRVPSASTFPLLEGTSVIGEASPVLTRGWATARAELASLIERGQVS